MSGGLSSEHEKALPLREQNRPIQDFLHLTYIEGEDEDGYARFPADYKYLMLDGESSTDFAFGDGIDKNDPQEKDKTTLNIWSGCGINNNTCTGRNTSDSRRREFYHLVENGETTPSKESDDVLTRDQPLNSRMPFGGSNVLTKINIWRWLNVQHTTEKTPNQTHSQLWTSVGNTTDTGNHTPRENDKEDDESTSVYSEASSALYYDAIGSPRAPGKPETTIETSQITENSLEENIENGAKMFSNCYQSDTNHKLLEPDSSKFDMNEHAATSRLSAIQENQERNVLAAQTSPQNASQLEENVNACRKNKQEVLADGWTCEDLLGDFKKKLYFGEMVEGRSVKDVVSSTQRSQEYGQGVGESRGCSMRGDAREDVDPIPMLATDIQAANARVKRRKPGSPMRQKTECHEKFNEEAIHNSIQNVIQHSPVETLSQTETNSSRIFYKGSSDRDSRSFQEVCRAALEMKEIEKVIQRHQDDSSSVDVVACKEMVNNEQENACQRPLAEKPAGLSEQKLITTSESVIPEGSEHSKLKEVIAASKLTAPQGQFRNKMVSEKERSDISNSRGKKCESATTIPSMSDYPSMSTHQEPVASEPSMSLESWQADSETYTSQSEALGQEMVLHSHAPTNDETASSGYKTSPTAKISKRAKKKAKTSLFDVRRFDSILEQIFPSDNPSIIAEVYNQSELYEPDAHTPADLLPRNTPPAIAYADREMAIGHSTTLHHYLLANPYTALDAVLPTQIPFLVSYQLQYAKNERDRYVDLGWTGNSMVYLGYDLTNNRYVAIKVKTRLRAAKEARMLQFLTGVDNIPVFYGALAMADKKLMGIVSELITDGTNKRSLRSKDISTFLTLEEAKNLKKDPCLTAYQWLDVCIGVCQIISTLHSKGVIANDISPSNFMLRLEGYVWVPYIADLSEACRVTHSSSIDNRLVPSARNKHWAPEVMAGYIRTEATDVYSLAYMIKGIYEKVRLPDNPAIRKGLAKDASQRPKAKQFMNKLIKQRSTMRVDNGEE